jgi:hypothetical protein
MPIWQFGRKRCASEKAGAVGGWVCSDRKCGGGYEGARVMPCSGRILGVLDDLWAEFTRTLRVRVAGSTEYASQEACMAAVG